MEKQSSYVTPIFKKGDKFHITNYRTLSKISILSKLFTKIVNNKIFLLCDKIIYNG